MSLLRVLTSAPAAALGLVIGLSGCIIDLDDRSGWRAQHECSVDARTSGAYDARITAVEGCTAGLTSFTSPAAAPELDRDIGVFPKDDAPFGRLFVTLYVPLEDEGEGIEVMITAIRDGVSWTTPAGACTANYISNTCNSLEGTPGRQYTIQDVHCSAPATAEGEQDLVIEDFELTSSCEPEEHW
jgi:hypothetical protein